MFGDLFLAEVLKLIDNASLEIQVHEGLINKI